MASKQRENDIQVFVHLDISMWEQVMVLLSIFVRLAALEHTSCRENPKLTK